MKELAFFKMTKCVFFNCQFYKHTYLQRIDKNFMETTMNIFVLSTGRCGSTTFARACEKIDNFSSSHESKSNHLGLERFSYPENHIEIDNRLSWLLGRLDQAYGNDAFYVHLKREDYLVAKSFTKRYERGIIKAYRGGGIIMGLDENSDPMRVSLDYCQTVNENIALFLKDKTHKMEFNLESYIQDFRKFWNLINAKGDYQDALAEFSVNHNASK